MKKIFVLFFLLFAAPVFAQAVALTPAQMQVQHLTAITAALQAQASALTNHASIACAAAVSKNIVAVNEPFALAWGSIGALPPSASSTVPMWTQNGVSEITIQQAGTWKYSFTFYAANGQTTTCTAKVVVVPTQ